MADRYRLILNLVVFLIVVWGITLAFSTDFEGLKPRGLEDVEDVVPTEGPSTILQEGIEVEDPQLDTQGQEPGFWTQVGQTLWGGFNWVTAGIPQAIVTTVDDYYNRAAIALGNMMDNFGKFTRIFGSVINYDLPALSGSPILIFIRLLVVVPTISLVGYLIFDTIRSLIPFLGGT